MQRLPVICPDTSVHNRMMKDGLESEAIFAALKSGYHVRLLGLSIEELLATPNTATRQALMAAAGRLQRGQSDCLYPHNEILRRLIAAHEQDPQRFRWQAVNVTSWDYSVGVGSLELRADDELSAATTLHMAEMRKQFKSVWATLRPKLDVIFQRDGQPRPQTFGEVIPHAMTDNGVFWGIAKGMYDHEAKAQASEETIRHFVEVCPPFRCIVYAFLMAWYNGSMRDWDGGESFSAGRNDLYMSVYLPYGDVFLSAEEKGEQAKCLAEIARLAEVDKEVLSYDDFCARLLLPLTC